MICYKGNSFFRNIKILIKDFDEKVKKPFKKKSIKVLPPFVQKDKLFIQNNKDSTINFHIEQLVDKRRT